MEARAFGIMLGEVCEQHDGVAAGDAGLTAGVYTPPLFSST
jgi:hypothetical protein